MNKSNEKNEKETTRGVEDIFSLVVRLDGKSEKRVSGEEERKSAGRN